MKKKALKSPYYPKPKHFYHEIHIYPVGDEGGKETYCAMFPVKTILSVKTFPNQTYLARGETLEECVANAKKSIDFMLDLMTPKDRQNIGKSNLGVSKVYLLIGPNKTDITTDKLEDFHKNNFIQLDQMKKYTDKKPLLKLNERYIAIFEYRNGITDGIKHTLKETGQKFGIGPTRARQIEARVWYEIEKI